MGITLLPPTPKRTFSRVIFSPVLALVVHTPSSVLLRLSNSFYQAHSLLLQDIVKRVVNKELEKRGLSPVSEQSSSLLAAADTRA